MQFFRRFPLAWYGVCAVFFSLIALLYIHLEQNVYYWDYVTYYDRAVRLNELAAQSPVKPIFKIFSSIWKADYNYLAAIIPSLFVNLTGFHRQFYILSILLFYFFPALILFNTLLKAIFPHTTRQETRLLCLIPLTSVAFIAPTLRGFVDIGGLAFIELAILLTLKTDFSEKQSARKALWLGALLWGAFLFRRWYAYTIVSLFLSLPVLNYALFQKTCDRQRLKTLLAHFALAGLSAVALVLLFQFGLLRKILQTDYATIYHGYQKPFSASVVTTLKATGAWILPFFVFGLVSLRQEKDRRIRLCVLFSAFNLFTSFFLFCRTQSPGIQHVIPFAFWSLIIALYGILAAGRRLHSASLRAVYGTTLLGLSGLATYCALFTQAPYRVPVLNALLPEQTNPLQIENYPAYQNLTADLVRDYQPHGGIAVLSSSAVLNESMLNTLGDQKLHLISISQLDLRDQFDPSLLRARYLVITTPVQTHLAPSEQRVITLPATEILSGSGIGHAYRKIGASYRLSQGVTTLLYEQVAPIAQEDLNSLMDRFYAFYPDWKKSPAH